jgi:hypothetical protein
MSATPRKQRSYTWFVEPRDAKTNEVIARELSAEQARQWSMCNDGINRDLWECNREFVSKLMRSKQQLELRFNIFVKEGQSGKIKPWIFDRKRKKK